MKSAKDDPVLNFKINQSMHNNDKKDLGVLTMTQPANKYSKSRVTLKVLIVIFFFPYLFIWNCIRKG